MSPIALKTQNPIEPRNGEYSAKQPLSGVSRVDASSSVSGLGHGGFIRAEKTEKTTSVV